MSTAVTPYETAISALKSEVANLGEMQVVKDMKSEVNRMCVPVKPDINTWKENGPVEAEIQDKLRQFVEVRKRIDAFRKNLKTPIDSVVELIQNTFQPLVNQLEDAKNHQKRLLDEYMFNREILRKEENDRLEKEVQEKRDKIEREARDKADRIQREAQEKELKEKEILSPQPNVVFDPFAEPEVEIDHIAVAKEEADSVLEKAAEQANGITPATIVCAIQKTPKLEVDWDKTKDIASFLIHLHNMGHPGLNNFIAPVKSAINTEIKGYIRAGVDVKIDEKTGTATFPGVPGIILKVTYV